MSKKTSTVVCLYNLLPVYLLKKTKTKKINNNYKIDQMTDGVSSLKH